VTQPPTPPPYDPGQPGQPGQPGPPYSQGQPGFQGQPGYGPPMPPYGYPAPTQSGKATASLVLGIVSLAMCGFFAGIPAMILGSQAKKEIRAAQGRIGGEGLATAGFVTGLVGTIWSAFAFLFVIGVFVFGGVLATSFDDCTSTSSDTEFTVEC